MRSPRPASTCRSRQEWEAFSVPSRNQVQCGGCHSSAVSGSWNHPTSRRVWSSQNPSRSRSAWSYSEVSPIRARSLKRGGGLGGLLLLGCLGLRRCLGHALLDLLGGAHHLVLHLLVDGRGAGAVLLHLAEHRLGRVEHRHGGLAQLGIVRDSGRDRRDRFGDLVGFHLGGHGVPPREWLFAHTFRSHYHPWISNESTR